MKQTQQGFFLHRTPFSDSSLIVTFYTQEKGIQKYLFKGGKRKAAALFPMALCELEFYGRPESSLLNLTKVESTKGFSFQFNPIKGVISYFLAEIVLKCFREENKDAFFFQFLKNQIIELDNAEKVTFYPIQFLVKLTDQLGIQPYIQSEKASAFHLDDGELREFLSPNTRSYQGKEVDLLIKILQETPIQTSEFPKIIRQKTLEILLEYLEIHIPNFNKLQSYEIIQEIL